MSKVIRLTESDLHRMIKESVKTILNENYREGEPRMVLISHILNGTKAVEIGEQEGLDEQEAAKIYFENTIESDEDFEQNKMPKYNRFICHIDYIDADLYYDYGANYYFCVKEI